MNQDELGYWLAFWRISGIGTRQFQAVSDRLGAVSELFGMSTAGLTEWGFNEQQRQQISAYQQGRDKALLSGVQRDLEWRAASAQHHIVTWADAGYPGLLREISGGPPLLFVRGDVDCLTLPQIAIVGSRQCSRSGVQLARDFARHFARAGFITTSGLALGIDAAAHTGALDGDQKTIAVLAHGLDTIYPIRNRALAEQVANRGALVSEFPIGVQPRPSYFPRRNRIISGLSLGVLVVEAALKSGSLITANVAADQGREVFAIPGSIHDPLARGCHALIRNGAKLVETADQVVEELLPMLGYLRLQASVDSAAPVVSACPDSSYAPDSVEHQIFGLLEYDPCSVDQLVQLTGLSVADISSALVLLELEGKIQQHRGGYCRL